jgi:hypothetical protein
MVRWYRDPTGRFNERPHYEAKEIDNECEGIVVRFLTKLHGRVTYPIKTDDLEKLIESKAHDLDMYADLVADGADVEGVTRFGRSRKPSVEISQILSESANRKNRLRTTLTHEFGHVHFHDSLFQMKLASDDLFAGQKDDRIVCKRDKMVDAPVIDWMEWQAGYASGAFLMPKSAVVHLIEDFRREHNIAAEITTGHEFYAPMIERVKERFDVSGDASRVRLIKLGFLASGVPQPTLL